MGALGAGYALEQAGAAFVCYDANPYFGGHTRSLRYEGGFVFDEGGHLSFTKNAHVREVLSQNVGGVFEERRLRIDNYWHGRRIPHPVQTNLHGLPSSLVARIVEDFIAARGTPKANAMNYAEWLHATYGATFAQTFPMVYGHKYHTTAMDDLTTDWLGPRMYRPTLEELIRGAMGEELSGTNYVDVFRYPVRGGFMTYLEPFAARFPIKLEHRVSRIDPASRTISFSNGFGVEYERVISSIPLPDLVPLIAGAPKAILDAAARLAFTQVVLINLGINRSDLSDSAITYFYDEDVIFSRINLPHMFSSQNAPQGCGTIQAEVYFSDKYRPLKGAPGDLIGPAIDDLMRCGIIKDRDQILLKDAVVNRYANVIYDHERHAAVTTVHRFLRENEIFYCGRYGNWDHAWTDEAFVSGEEAAQRALQSQN
jgi:protoporphyrinogen oxidase